MEDVTEFFSYSDEKIFRFTPTGEVHIADLLIEVEDVENDPKARSGGSGPPTTSGGASATAAASPRPKPRS
jgi:hypothetical protein